MNKTDTSKINFDDFAKVEMKIGRIESAELIEKSDKLLKLAVNFGEFKQIISEGEDLNTKEPHFRQVISGIRKQFEDPTQLIGRSFVFITNLEPRMIMGFESQAMILAAKDENGLALMSPTIEIPPGTPLS